MQRLRRQPELGSRDQRKTPKRHGLKGLLVTAASIIAFSASAPGTEKISFPSASARQAEANEKVKELIGILKKGNDKERSDAVRELVMARESVPYLIEALKDTDCKVRISVAKVLGKIGVDKSHFREILRILSEGEGPEEKEGAAVALGEVRSTLAVPELLRALNDESPEVRISVVEALEKIMDPSAAPHLIDRLKDGDWRVRWKASHALGRIGVNDKQFEAILAMLLEGESEDEREGAAMALGEIQDTKAIEALTEALERDESRDVRAAAVKAFNIIRNVYALIDKLKYGDWKTRLKASSDLEKIGEPAVPALIKALKSKSPEVKNMVIGALGGIKDVSAVPALIEALSDKDEGVRTSIVWALKNIGEPAVPALIEASKAKNLDVRQKASVTLAMVGEPAIRYVTRALEDTDPKMREFATEVLGRIAEKNPGRDKFAEAVPVLIGLLKDEDWGVRWNAAWALGHIGDGKALPVLLEVMKNDQNKDIREAAKNAVEKISK